MSPRRLRHRRATVIEPDEVMRHLRILRHAGVGLTQVELIRANPAAYEPEHFYGVYSADRYLKLVSDLDALAAQHNDARFRIYVRANPLVESALKYADHVLRSAGDIHGEGHVPLFPGKVHVDRRTNFLFDLDARGSDANTPTTDDQKAASIELAREIRRHEPLLERAALFDSGNNAYLLAAVPPGHYDDGAAKAFYQSLRDRFGLQPKGGTGPCKLDHVHYSNVLMGVAGTLKFKGDDPSLWRMQRVLDDGGLCDGLARHLLIWVPPAERTDERILSVVEAAEDDAQLADRIGGWCPGYQELWVSSDFDDRSLAAFHLALKMFHDGWPVADIDRALRIWAGRLRYAKIARVLQDLREKIPQPRYAKSRPSHRFVVELLGYCPCPGGCDVEQAIAHSSAAGLRDVEWDGEATSRATLPLVDAREDLRHFFEVGLTRILGAEEPRLFLSAGPPGLGKTALACRLARYTKTLILTPQKKEFEKLRGDLSVELDGELETVARRVSPDGEKADEMVIVSVVAREEACERPAERAQIEKLARAGVRHLAERRVCSGCPRYLSCSYYTQFNPGERASFIASSAWMKLPRFQRLADRVDLIIFDEDPLDFAFAETRASTRELQRMKTLVGAYLPEVSGQVGHVVDGLIEAARRCSSPWVLKDGSLTEVAAEIDLEDLGRRYRGLEGEVDVGELPSLPLVDLLRGLANKGNTRPTVIVRPGEIHLARFLPVTVDKPIMVLDSTGDERLYQILFPAHEIVVDRASAAVTAEVLQIWDEKLPLQSLKSAAKLKQVSAVIRAITEKRERELGPGVAVIGRQAVIEKLSLPEGVKRGHYWAQRGTREFEDCHTMVLVGAAEPAFEDLQVRAQVMLGRPVDTSRQEETRPYGLTSTRGRSRAAEVKTYADPDLRALYSRLREGEMIQAAFRIRPLDGKTKLIIILSSLPLAGLPPDRLLTLNELEVELGLKAPPMRAQVLQAQEALRHELGREPTHAEIGNRMGVSRARVSVLLKE